jgi:hypothetical protein
MEHKLPHEKWRMADGVSGRYAGLPKFAISSV